MERLRKRPSTSELIDWIAMLQSLGITEVQQSPDTPFLGTLLKKEQDLQAFDDEANGRGKRRFM